jgi:ribosomal 30S subunit maturation factor RimM
MFGFKLSNKVWLETHATLGQIKNFMDNEALYIYDALDVGKFRIGATLLIPFTSKFSLLTNYYYEQKQLYLLNTKYNLNSFTIGISWKL